MLNERKEWSIIDNSKLSTFRLCQRKYFFEHVLGWLPDSLNIDLHFGTAHHEAMAYLMEHGTKKENFDGAINAFMVLWIIVE